MSTPLDRGSIVPLCAVCIEAGRATEATHQTRDGLCGCGQHIQQLEQYGRAAVRRQRPAPDRAAVLSKEYVSAAPEMMTSAAADLATIGSDLNAAHTAAAAPTVAVMPAAADEVSAAIAAVFGRYAQGYQTLADQAAAFHDQFVQTLSAGAASYASTESANASVLQTLEHEIPILQTVTQTVNQSLQSLGQSLQTLGQGLQSLGQNLGTPGQGLQSLGQSLQTLGQDVQTLGQDLH